MCHLLTSRTLGGTPNPNTAQSSLGLPIPKLYLLIHSTDITIRKPPNRETPAQPTKILESPPGRKHLTGLAAVKSMPETWWFSQSITGICFWSVSWFPLRTHLLISLGTEGLGKSVPTLSSEELHRERKTDRQTHGHGESASQNTTSPRPQGWAWDLSQADEN